MKRVVEGFTRHGRKSCLGCPDSHNELWGHLLPVEELPIESEKLILSKCHRAS